MKPRQRRIPADRSVDLISGVSHGAADLIDASNSGLRVRLRSGGPVDADQTVTISNGIDRVDARVCWVHDGEAGITFLAPLSSNTLYRLTGVRQAGGGARWG